MSNVTVQARISPQLKDDANTLFAAMGLSTSDAIRIFLQQSVNIGGLPFQPTTKQPNLITRKAIEELKHGGGKSFNTVDELFSDLDDE